MERRMTVVQALEERDLLMKRITKYTRQGCYVDLIGPGPGVTQGQKLSREEFAVRAQAALQRIRDLTARYDRLTEAILASNASAWLETSRGRMTVAAAVALRGRMCGSGPCGGMTDFEGRLIRQMRDQYEEARRARRPKGGFVQGNPKAQNRQAGKHTGKQAGKHTGAEAALRAGFSIVTAGQGKEEKLRLCDPLDILQRAEKMEEEREEFLMELETGIRISNATTYVTV